MMVIRVNDEGRGLGVAYNDGRVGAVGPRCMGEILSDWLTIDTRRDFVNGPNEMDEVLDRLFQANLISKNT